MASPTSVVQSLRFQNDLVLEVLAVDATAATNYIWNATCPRSLRVVDFWTVNTTGTGGACTATLRNGANAITNAVDVNKADGTITRAGTIDDARHELVRGGTLSVFLSGTGEDTFIAYVLLAPVS